ncbi:MAG: hypothetical protein KGZ43_10025 [Sulfuritalea sp.]|nr:hypothetical protein [Sulfuritalea sp.]
MLSLEPLLRARLAEIAGLKGVHGLADLGAEKVRPAPCAYVVYDGARVLATSVDRVEARLAVRWLVVLAVKEVSGAADGQAARTAAQPLVAAILGLLMGWRPDPAHMELKLVECPRPDFQGGLLWLPLVFETEQILKGDDQ